jgi:hypothetical protein
MNENKIRQDNNIRQACIVNDHRQLEGLIKARANVCSVDEFGLTALHYAVWNSHIECVKLLAFNSNGLDAAGNRASCLNMKSCIGLTALHLVAMECSCPKAASEITTILLLAGADPLIEDLKSRNAYHAAIEVTNTNSGRQAFLDALQHYIEVRKGCRDATEYQEKFTALTKKYRFFSENISRQLDADFLKSLPFLPPDFLICKERVGRLPVELSVHEHHIMPLANHGFVEKRGVDALRCLQFTQEQAELNAARRERLANASDPNRASQTEHSP